MRPMIATPVPVQLRSATADDADDIAALLGELGYPVSPPEVPSRLRAIIDEGGTVVLAVDSTDAALGMMALARHVTLHTSAPVAYITALVTARSARRRGVGRMLVEEAKRWARSTGCNRLTLTSAEHRSDAHAFYPSCGLPYTGRRFATPISELENP
jgi:GNAT superfamily N-acetyltransferase